MLLYSTVSHGRDIGSPPPQTHSFLLHGLLTLTDQDPRIFKLISASWHQLRNWLGYLSLAGSFLLAILTRIATSSDWKQFFSAPSRSTAVPKPGPTSRSCMTGVHHKCHSLPSHAASSPEPWEERLGQVPSRPLILSHSMQFSLQHALGHKGQCRALNPVVLATSINVTKYRCQ